MRLPTWDETKIKCEHVGHNPTQLDTFIYLFEPAMDNKSFREELSKLIDYFERETQNEIAQMLRNKGNEKV